jgi:hypothetical protein
MRNALQTLPLEIFVTISSFLNEKELLRLANSSVLLRKAAQIFIYSNENKIFIDYKPKMQNFFRIWKNLKVTLDSNSIFIPLNKHDKQIISYEITANKAFQVFQQQKIPSQYYLSLQHQNTANWDDLKELIEESNCNITHLNLSNIKISQKNNFDLLVQHINNTNNLIELNLSLNNFSYDEVIKLNEALKNNKSIRKLTLYKCNLTDENAKIFAETLIINNTISEISFNGNNFTNIVLEYFNHIKNDYITKIDLRYNKLDLKSLPSNLTSNLLLQNDFTTKIVTKTKNIDVCNNCQIM